MLLLVEIILNGCLNLRYKATMVDRPGGLRNHIHVVSMLR